MLFRTLNGNTLMPATWADIEMAGAQGTITGVKLANGHIQGSDKSHPASNVQFGKSLDQRSRDNARLIVAWLFLLMSIVTFSFFLYRYCVTLEDGTSNVSKEDRKAMHASLVDRVDSAESDEDVAAVPPPNQGGATDDPKGSTGIVA